VLDKKNIKGDLGVELVRMHISPSTNREIIQVYPMHQDKSEGNKLYFSASLKSPETGLFKLGVRIYPDNKDMPHRMDFAYVKWINI
jgi:starch phosphorylase